MRNGHTIIDADGHVMEPDDLWDRYIDREFRGVRPLTDPRYRGSVDVLGHRMSRSYEDTRYRDFVNRMWAERHAEDEAQGYSAQNQVAAMEKMGIDKMFLYPSRGLYAASVADLDGRLASAICRAYNRWLAEFTSYDPDRLYGVALVGLQDPALAADEVRYAVTELGMWGVMIRPNPYAGRNLHDPAYDDFYATLVELGVPLATHEGTGVWMPEFGFDRFDEHIAWHAMAHPMEQMGAVLSFTTLGVFERHPELQVAFLEAGGTWLPYWLNRLDEHVEWVGEVETPDLTMLPSEYFRRNGWIGVEGDEPGVRALIEYVGADRILWASDYPHPDAGEDPVTEFFEDVGDELTDDEFGRILDANPRAYYRL